MRDYGKVHTTFWTSSSIRDLSENARLLAMYLLTCPHGTIAGVFRLPDGYACEDLQWTPGRVEEGFDELFLNGFAKRCGTTKWVWVVKHLEWNPPENPNQRKSACKVIGQIPDACDWKLDFMRACGPSLGLQPPEHMNGYETLGEGLLNQKQEQQQEQKQEQDRETGAGEPAAPAEPSRSPRGDKTLKTYVDECRAAGVKPIPDDHFIRTYCRDVGISDDMAAIAWLRFRDEHLNGTRKNKRYKDWPAAFANSVKERWYKLWLTNNDGEATWTSEGLQAKRAVEARRAAEAQEQAG